MPKAPIQAAAPPVLVVCHPGHELLVYGWMKAVRPHVCVLTDGSGGERPSRLAKTSAIVENVGATRGPIFGRITDADLYAHLLSVDIPFFVDLAEELADFFERTRTAFVVGDAPEGYNSGHDVCRLLIDAAVALTIRRTDRPIRNFAYPLVDHPGTGERAALRWTLETDVWLRKLAAARDYPELAGEVERAVARLGIDAFAVETLFALEPFALPRGPAFYERFGAERVESGKYPEIICQADHLAPLADALRDYAYGGLPWAA